MHEVHVPSCDHCKKFVFSFSKESQLADWGFCLLECGGVPPSEKLTRELEAAIARGEYTKVYNTKGLYQDTEDGCEQYEPR